MGRTLGGKHVLESVCPVGGHSSLRIKMCGEMIAAWTFLIALLNWPSSIIWRLAGVCAVGPILPLV